MTAPLKLFPFDVRPFHRETVDSYSARLLTANFSNNTHRADLTRNFAADASTIAQREAWARVLTLVTKRRALHLDPQPNGSLTDGHIVCQHFANTLPARFACTLCSHGAIVEQHPHFDTIVCTRHTRWLGLWGAPARQHHADPVAVHAQRVFAKLRRKNLIDVRLYLYLTKATAQALHPGIPIENAEPLVFAPIIRTIEAITSDAFARRFFTLTGTFANAFTHLSATVTNTIGQECPAIIRALWIYLQPTMRSLRDAITLNEPFAPTSQHDYPLRHTVARDLISLHGELEPAERYLAITGDTPVTAAVTTANLSMLFTLTEHTEPRHFTCPKGHEFDYLPPAVLPPSMTATQYVPTCGLCTARRVRPGKNDLQSQSPRAAAQFDIYRNGGLTAADVATSSSTTHSWTCAKGHSHDISPSKKTLTTYNCPLCSNRTTRYGTNCLLTTHPKYAAMWAEGWSETRSPATLSASAPSLATFRCTNGHLFTARPWKLISGKEICDTCIPERIVNLKDSLAVTHPAQAARWHPTLNGELTPENVTHGQRTEAWWLCDKGHAEKARIDKITYGRQCSLCNSRTLSPGETDLASVEPVISLELHPTYNPKKATEIFPSDHLLAWQCFAHSHLHWQTTQNRRSSRGCPRCKSTERITSRAMVARIRAQSRLMKTSSAPG